MHITEYPESEINPWTTLQWSQLWKGTVCLIRKEEWSKKARFWDLSFWFKKLSMWGARYGCSCLLSQLVERWRWGGLWFKASQGKSKTPCPITASLFHSSPGLRLPATHLFTGSKSFLQTVNIISLTSQTPPSLAKFAVWLYNGFVLWSPIKFYAIGEQLTYKENGT
jgi:hypothetical protein